VLERTFDDKFQQSTYAVIVTNTKHNMS